MSNYDSGSLASLKLKFQVVFTLLVVIGALLIPWFILAESSPLASPNSDLPLIWSPTVMVPFLISAVITRNPHSSSLVLMILILIIQWSILGFLLAIPLARVWVRLIKK